LQSLIEESRLTEPELKLSERNRSSLWLKIQKG
jgi:hypothetical protein